MVRYVEDNWGDSDSDSDSHPVRPSVEAGSNTSTVALRVVGSDEKEPNAWGYNRATLFLRDIKYGDLVLQVDEISSETVKYGHESRGTLT
jgi:hypothetical protein